MDFREENPLSVSSVGAAVRKNDVEGLIKSIEKGRNIDLQDNRGWAALHCAASENYTDCLIVLLKAGADVNIRTHEGETPLFLACRKNCQQAVAVLLKAKALVNLPNHEHVTPLHVVASLGHDELAITLLKDRAKINALDYDRDTPLLEAVRHGKVNMCRILLSRKANQRIGDSMKNLPIHYACQENNLEILKLLLYYSKSHKKRLKTIVNWTNIDGYSPLMLAVVSKSLPLVEELLRFGADANIGVCSEYGVTALHLAARSRYLPILKTILNATSEETIRQYCCESDGQIMSYKGASNLILHTIYSQSEECLEYILNCGLDSQVFNSHRPSTHPITYILDTINNFDYSAFRLLKILLQSGFDVNYYIKFPKFHPYRFLLEPNIPNELAEATIHLLVEHGLNIDYFIPDFYRSVPYLFANACMGGRFQLIPFLLQRSNVVEPSDLMFFILESISLNERWLRKHDVSKLLVFLSHYFNKTSNIYLKNKLKSYQFFGHLLNFPSLKSMARSVVREYIHHVCSNHSHQFKVKLNSLLLPVCLESFLNYDDMQNVYESLDKNEHSAASIPDDFQLFQIYSNSTAKVKYCKLA